jgi:hypothetical protein
MDELYARKLALFPKFNDPDAVERNKLGIKHLGEVLRSATMPDGCGPCRFDENFWWRLLYVSSSPFGGHYPVSLYSRPSAKQPIA